MSSNILSEGWALAIEKDYLESVKVLYDQHEWTPIELFNAHEALCDSQLPDFCLTLRQDENMIAAASLQWLKSTIQHNEFISFRTLVGKRIPANIRPQDVSFSWMSTILLSKKSYSEAYMTAGIFARFRMMEYIVSHTRIDSKSRQIGDWLAYQLLENVQSSWSSLRHLLAKYMEKLPESYHSEIALIYSMEQLGHYWVDLDRLLNFYMFLDRLDKVYNVLDELQNRMDLNDVEQELLTRLEDALIPTPIQDINVIFDPMLPYEPLFPPNDKVIE